MSGVKVFNAPKHAELLTIATSRSWEITDGEGNTVLRGSVSASHAIPLDSNGEVVFERAACTGYDETRSCS